MADIWKETFRPSHPGDHMPGFAKAPFGPPTLLPQHTWFVRVCSFTFSFRSLDQIKECLAYYEQKIHPSSRVPENLLNGCDHWENQRWFEKLPMYLLEEPKRKKVVQALRRAIRQFSEE